ncbi:hypothetical protein ACL9RL_01295 [Plantibacter sp. Mn2098]|uniref:hypothetical protein n=1 Tax=Plantibacter sp. Mn2098 TaxID=3395266 RepID=UPI003BDA2B74
MPLAKRPLVVAAAAATVGVLLFSGAMTQASWGGSQNGQATLVTSGSLLGTISAATVAYPTIGGAPPANIVIRPGSSGMIPGVKAQSFSYTVTNTSQATGATAPASFLADVTLTFASTVTDAAAYAAALPYLSVSSTVTKGSVSRGVTTTGCVTASGIVCSPPLSTAVTLLPGESAVVLVTFQLSAAGLAPLNSIRSSTTDVSPIFSFTPTVNLTQLPRSQA